VARPPFGIVSRGRGAAFADDLVKSAVEPGERVGHVIGRAQVGGAGRRLRRGAHAGEPRLGHAFELAGQVVETLVDGREVLIEDIVVVQVSV